MPAHTARHPLVIGLTGGIASGKTAVSERFRQHGAHVIDTDIIAREVVAADTPALAEIRQYFGDGVITADGHLDRAALRARVFADADERAVLERITHPRIRERVMAQLRATAAPYAVVVVPLLIEAGWADRVDRVAVVDVPETVQVARLMTRDSIDAASAEAMLAAQTARSTRLAAADDVIANTGDLGDLDARVAELDREYREIAGKVS